MTKSGQKKLFFAKCIREKTHKTEQKVCCVHPHIGGFAFYRQTNQLSHDEGMNESFAYKKCLYLTLFGITKTIR